MTSPAALADAQFVQLTTFRRDGTGVPTAVWVVPLPGGELGVWTPSGSGKVKRIRRSGDVTLAVCDRRGTPSGPAVPATARILDAAGVRTVRDAVRRKYGLLGRVLTAISQRRGAGPAGLAITLTA
ncbi:PPOX class F420-dependent oxidoreductase [Pseudonocardia broussonetiae]|uniref:PPOX class F420-dependent oxidoreductase n=1 Tax=Pseudonocardia broussonetiae TaxID=2736640 RepID=A0A6M6JLY0_9PSEU|nr:PPOX class F420-dependent oxidoreductase [Pseudonocardia broussonetiae]QJY47652.1 PPOX class F420-dependent oxidoreductase [Pseudonocardia broussonetiae]